MLQRRGAKVGLITTRGHRDVIHIMRGARGVPGLNNVQVLHFPESSKPDPIVPKPLIAEVSERVDCKGQVVVELNEEEAEAAIAKLMAKGVESIAICFLWSFKFAEHERRVKAMVERLAPGRLRVLLGRPHAPLGRVRAHGGDRAERVSGPGDVAVPRPARVARAGGRACAIRCKSCSAAAAWSPPPSRRGAVPHAGLRPGGRRARLAVPGRTVIGHKHVIATDMGGTSFDVGLV